MGERPAPDAPHPGRRRPPRAPSCPPDSTQSQLARACAVGLVTGPHACTTPHPQPVGSGPRQPAQRAGSRGWESARPRTPHIQARGAPAGQPHAAPTARKASSQERALWGLVTGPHAHSPRTLSQWVVGPGSPPRGRAVGGLESARPRTPHTQARGAPPGHLHAAPTARKSARCGVGDGSPRPHPPHPQPVGSGPRQPAQRAGSRGWESARPRTPHTQAGGAPRGHPQAAPTAWKASSQERALWGW